MLSSGKNVCENLVKRDSNQKGSGTEVKFNFSYMHRTRYKIIRMCDVLEVSPSGYYDWKDRPESVRCQRHRQLISEIKVIHQRSRAIYGSPRIHEELIDNGVVVGKNIVARLMRHHKIQSKVH